MFGMPGPVWTMALWFASAVVIISLSLAFPLSTHGRVPLRAIVLAYAVVVVISLLAMKARTPTWFLYLQTGVAIAAGLWLTYASVTPAGTVTSAISFIVVAAYMGFWMPIRDALAYMLVTSVTLFALLAVSERIPQLLVPWALICGVSIGLLVSFGTLVAGMNAQLVTDPLTGLLNRSGMAQLIDLHAEAGRVVEPRALIVIDLDQFKVINDRDGHLAGDATLHDFGAALRAVTRPDDIAIRSGGDEFVVILPRTDPEGAEALVRRLRSAMPLEWSYGLTEWTTDESFDAALARADRSMYVHKAARTAERSRHD